MTRTLAYHWLLFLREREPSTDSVEMSIDESQGQNAKEDLSGIKRSTNVLTSLQDLEVKALEEPVLSFTQKATTNWEVWGWTLGNQTFP